MSPETGVEGPAGEGNAAQAEAWNGESGRHWVRYRERREAQLRNFSPHLFAAARIGAYARVLDVGCGCGGTTVRAAKLAVDGHALGVDLSAPMLAQARRSAAADGMTNVTFERADVQVHPFAEATFDVAISRFGVMFFAEPGRAFGNIARALRPGGRLAFVCWREQAANEFYTLPRRALAAHVELSPGGADASACAGGGQQGQGQGQGPGPFSLADPEEVRSILTAAGFDAVDFQAVAEPMWAGADVEDAVTYQETTPTIRAAFATAGAPARVRAVSALREALAARLTPRGVELGGSAWVVTALRRAD